MEEFYPGKVIRTSRSYIVDSSNLYARSHSDPRRTEKVRFKFRKFIKGYKKPDDIYTYRY